MTNNTPNDRLRILFIEDHIDEAQALSKLITKKMPDQVEALFETTLREGVQRSRETFPCIVFLDLLLPDTGDDWRAAANAIKNIHGVVIVVTELDDIDVELECRANGALMVFTKSKIPSIIEVIVHVIANLRLNALARSTVAKGQ